MQDYLETVKGSPVNLMFIINIDAEQIPCICLEIKIRFPLTAALDQRNKISLRSGKNANKN